MDKILPACRSVWCAIGKTFVMLTQKHFVSADKKEVKMQIRTIIHVCALNQSIERVQI